MSKLNFYQTLMRDWGVRCFGEAHMNNEYTRALRLVEECVEYAQTASVKKEQLHELIDMIYDRSVGTAIQELGGVFVTTLAACSAEAYQAEHVLEREIHRVLSKDPAEFRKRNEEKNNMGFK